MSLTTYGTKIDLREIPLRDRSALLFNTYRALQPGQSMELMADQDLELLHTQFRLQEPTGFSWAPLEAGPTAWRVRVVRLTGAQREDSCCSCSCSCP
jgi:uncharacterized protein (DUF2249 family)